MPVRKKKEEKAAVVRMLLLKGLRDFRAKYHSVLRIKATQIITLKARVCNGLRATADFTGVKNLIRLVEGKSFHDLKTV